MSEIHVKPEGMLSLQTIAMPADTNWSGDVFGGWIVSQMDLAGAIHAERFSKGLFFFKQKTAYELGM